MTRDSYKNPMLAVVIAATSIAASCTAQPAHAGMIATKYAFVDGVGNHYVMNGHATKVTYRRRSTPCLAALQQ